MSGECFKAIKGNFEGFFCSEEETFKTIKETFENNSYLIDTHTAVAVKCADDYIRSSGDTKKMLIVSTASPYKFASDVLYALTGKRSGDEFAALNDLSLVSGTEVLAPLKDIDKREVRFKTVIEKDKMKEAVLSTLCL